ncbi:MAG TPA: SRPBCC domain-containing protein [Flavobacteriales bacterium]|nr:SRPBCC domain-containing protein [Flavobacteriales bacterium]
MTSPCAAPPITTEVVQVRRVFAAGCERIWRALTHAADLAAWWGPNGFTNTVYGLDVWPGASFHIAMRSAEGQAFSVEGLFEQLVPPIHAAVRFRITPEGGKPFGMNAVFTLLPCDDDGQLTVRVERPAHLHDVPMSGRADWGQCFDRLEELVLKGCVHND